jgi:hypothetical protein
MCDECVLAMGEVFQYFCQQAKGNGVTFPPLKVFLKYSSLVIGVFFVVSCTWLFLTCLLTFYLSKAIISAYLVYVLLFYKYTIKIIIIFTKGLEVL